MAKYKTFADLGAEVQRRHPSLASRDPEELGRKAAEKYGIRVGEDRSFASKAFDDLGRTIGEDVGGLVDAISSPIQTAKGLGKLLGGAADINLGTDFVDDETEELARGAGNQFIDEIKDFENRPVRALSNLAVGAGPLGMLGKLGKAGKLGKIARVAHAAEYADPLTAIGRGVGGVVSGVGKGAGSMVKRANDAMTPVGGSTKGELMDSFLGFTTGRDQVAFKRLRELLSDPLRRDDVLKGVKGGARAGNDATDRLLRGFQKIQSDASTHYRRAFDELSDAGIIDKQIANPRQRIAGMFNNAFQEAEMPGVVLGDAADFNLIMDKIGLTAQSRAKVGQLYSLLDEAADTGTITVGKLDEIKKLLDDELSVLDNASELSKGGKRVIQKLRNEVRSTLSEEAGPVYDRAMSRYQKRIQGLEDANEFLGFDRDKVRTLSNVNDASSGERLAQKDLGNRAAGFLSSKSSDAANRDDVLGRIEHLSRDKGLRGELAGAEFSPIAGSGLVVRSELSQAGRAAFGIVTSLNMVGALTIPLALMFSPKAVALITAKLIQDGVPGAQAARGAKRLASIGQKTHNNLKAKGVNVGGLRLENITLGDLIRETRRPASQERRLEKDQKQKNIFRTLGAR